MAKKTKPKKKPAPRHVPLTIAERLVNVQAQLNSIEDQVGVMGGRCESLEHNRSHIQNYLSDLLIQLQALVARSNKQDQQMDRMIGLQFRQLELRSIDDARRLEAANRFIAQRLSPLHARH